jgi:WD40 repeat protein
MEMVTCGQARSHETRLCLAVWLTLVSFSLSSASADETIQLHVHPPPTIGSKRTTPVTHTRAFRAVLPIYLYPELDSDTFPYLLAGSGDCIRVYDISSFDEVEFKGEIEGHWHDVTHLRTWVQVSGDGARKEEWIVSGSLDGTLRKWKLSGTNSVSTL